jgi:hypothetical protein
MIRLRAGGPLLLSLAVLASAALAGGSCSKGRGEAPGRSAATDGHRPAATVDIERVEGGTPAEQHHPTHPVDACARINHHSYASRQKGVCGPPEDDGTGPLCHHRLHFADGAYEWQYTDMLISGKYACDGLKIRALTPDPQSGHLDLPTGHIFWEGVEYVPVRNQ